MKVEWWNADTGALISTQRLAHPGDALTLTAPSRRRHPAFKLIR